MTASFKSFPDISAVIRKTFPVIWLDREYEFIITNNLRSETFNLRITTKDEDGNEVVVAKNITLAINIDLMPLYISEYWQGRMYLLANGQEDINPTRFDISTNYSILLITEDEFSWWLTD